VTLLRDDVVINFNSPLESRAGIKTSNTSTTNGA